jgi:hypothetical protein
MNFPARGGSLGSLSTASRFPLHIAVFPALSLAIVVGVLVLIVSNHSLRVRKNSRKPGENARSHSQDRSDDRFGS